MEVSPFVTQLMTKMPHMTIKAETEVVVSKIKNNNYRQRNGHYEQRSFVMHLQRRPHAYFFV